MGGRQHRDSDRHERAADGGWAAEADLYVFNFSPDGEGLRAAFAAVIQNGEAKLIKAMNVE